MTRRELLAGAAGALAAQRLSAFKTHLTKAHISAITDEIGKTQADAIDFAHHYGLQLVELRNVPETKKEFALLSEPELKRWATELEANKLKVSFLNTSLLKFTWPGLVPANGKPETPERKAANQKRWDRRKEDVTMALNAANILGVDKIRVFTGTRVENPESTYSLIVRTMEELIPLFEKAKCKLLIENEYSQNIGTSAETRDIMGLLPSQTVGYNWDPGNAVHLKETPWPDGYKVLPLDRMLNAQFKWRGLTAGSGETVDWKSIVIALQKDNYKHALGLETHAGGPALIENANDAMSKMLRIVEEVS
ncbi:MAG: TIM barrel protein [Acidobacteriota bacterium]|nr:TIM barrel protein [Acidobacteriota bacterium]